MVEFEHADFAYGASEVLRDANLTVEPGSFCAVHGLRGAGKTTLMRLLRGEIAPDAGEIRVLGRPVPVGRRDALARMRRRIGLVEQCNRFLDHLPLAENVAVPLLAEGNAGGRTEDILALLAWVGLAGRAGDRPSALQPHENRRAALARAVINSPDLVLADEPVAGLPRDEALDLLGLFLDLHAMGTTILFATGDADLLEHMLATRKVQVADLAEGRLETVA